MLFFVIVWILGFYYYFILCFILKYNNEVPLQLYELNVSTLTDILLVPEGPAN